MYRIFDRVIQSSIDLPELEPARGGKPDIRFTIASGERAGERAGGRRWQRVHEWTMPDGTVSITCSSNGHDYLLGFPRLASFLVSGSGAVIRCFPQPGMHTDAIRHLLLDQVIPRVMAHRGRLVLHASAVVLADGATAAFLGHTGWGKSTLAAALHERGAMLVTDDCLLVERRGETLLGIPAYPGLRLWPGADVHARGFPAGFVPLAQTGGKRRFKPSGGHHRAGRGPYRLAGLFLLDSPDCVNGRASVELAPVAGREALLSMLSCLFALNARDRDRAEANFLECGQVLRSGVPVYRLAYARKAALLDDVCRAIFQCLGSEARRLA